MKQFFTLLLTFISLAAFAQAPPNDECAEIIDLGIAPFCPEGVFYSNDDATPSDALPGNEAPTDCDGVGEPQTDVWFQFTAVDTILNYTITVTGIDDPTTPEGPMSQPVVVVYRGEGPCVDMEQLQCAAAGIGQGSVELVFEEELTPFAEYYVRVFDYSVTGTPNSGDFQLCIEETEVPPNWCEDIFTTDCSGTLFDCGGPEGDYDANTNVTFTVTPEGGAECIAMSFIYYNLEAGFGGGGDVITFYDGPDTNSPVLDVLAGSQSPQDNSGGVCFQAFASSGSLTMQFVSNGNLQFEGFEAFWECFNEPCPETDGLLTVTENATEEEIINSLTTPQTLLSNLTIDCPDGASGTFANGDITNLGLTQGLVLTSGRVTDAVDGFGIGVNNPATEFASTSHGTPGDADLDALSPNSLSNDACVIELDVFANTNELSFEYVFGSEEYPGFTTGSFNDIFALLLSGPGVVGDPLLDNQLNLATLPDGTVVQIDQVNTYTNNEYFRINENSESIVYGGLTSDFNGVKKSLTASAEVTPCETYHLKFAIADRGDTAFDSGVFISEIRGGSPTVGIDYQNGIQYLVEECTSVPDEVVINIGDPLDFDQTFEVIIGGTATQGTDYSLNIPPTITFPAGDSIQSFPISVITDGVVEGIETITITLRANFGCGDIVLSELNLEIEDALLVDIDAGAETVFSCTDSCVVLTAVGAPNYIWTPAANFPDGNNLESVQTCPTENFTATVVGFLGPCTAVDMVEVVVVDPILTIATDDPVNICEGDSVQLFANNNVDNANLTFTPDDGSVGPIVNNNTTVMPTVTTTYNASVEVAGCIAEDEITINVDPFDFPELRTDTTLCQNTSTVLATAIESSTTTFSWSPVEGLSDPMISNPIATPDETTTYTLTATSDNNFCEKSETVTITVIPSDVDLENEPPIELCLGESVDLNVASTHPDLVVWTPEEGLSTTTGTSVTADPTVSTTYIASLETPEGCMTADTIFVRVDSLPESALVELIPQKDVYCEGEVVTFVFPVYEPADYPDIMHQWLPDGDFQFESADTLWNMVISTLETTTFTRETVNRACSVTESLTIEVIEIPDLILTVEPTEICQGETVQLQLTSEEELASITWDSQGAPLSCDDCEDPTSTPNTTTTYSATAETAEGDCPLIADPVTVTVLPLPVIDVDPEETICPGDDAVILNAGNDADNFIWTDADGNVVSTTNLFTASPEETTTYTISATNDEGNCGAATEQVTVFVIDAPTIAVQSDADLICPGDEIQILATGNISSGSIDWEPTGQSGTDTITVAPQVTTTYTATATECDITVSDEITIEVSPQYVIDSITVNPQSVFEGELVTLTAFTTPAALPGATYVWSFNGIEIETQGMTITVPAPDFTADPSEETQEVSFSVVVLDAAGCDQSAESTFEIMPSVLEMPNVFTPNNDELNDFFNPVFSGTIELLSFSIYNRWGQEVYNNETPETGWDGMYNDKPAPADVYVYVVRYTDVTGTEVTEKGDVTLLR